MSKVKKPLWKIISTSYTATNPKSVLKSEGQRSQDRHWKKKLRPVLNLITDREPTHYTLLFYQKSIISIWEEKSYIFFLMGMKLKNSQWSVWVCKGKIKFSDSWGKLPLKTWFVKIQNLEFNIQGSMGQEKVLFKISFINWKLKTAAKIRLF